MFAEYDALYRDDPVYDVEDRNEEILAEIDPVTVEIPAEDFKGLLPGPDMSEDDVGKVKGFHTIDFSQLGSEAEDVRYTPLCEVFNSFSVVSKGKGKFKITGTHCETKELDIGPGLAYYPEGIREATKAILREVAKDNPDVARCAWAWMIIAIEVKCNDEDSGYGFNVAYPDKNGRVCIPLLRNTPEGRTARAQFLTYAAEQFQRQPRTHVYSLYISGPAARFFRFDRAGCLVSTPIDLHSQFDLFRNIVYRLLNLSPKDQGFDPTVKLASPASLRDLRACRPKHKAHLDKYYHDFLAQDESMYPIYEVTCPVISVENSSQIEGVDDAGERLPAEQRRYFIGKPLTTRASPTGRCTKGYVAFELETKRFVFLKDQWRAITRRPELDVYRRLHSRLQHQSLQYIVTPIAGGDIDDQRTLSQKYMGHLDRFTRAVERVHTRLITKEVGRPLETYRGSYELIKFVRHAYLGHTAAWEDAQVLHHDVSPGNILIDDETGKAFLNDWDLAKYAEDLYSGAAAVEPAGLSGTWPFKSALSLRYPFKPAEVADDIESFVYVILYMAMRFHFHKLSSAASKNSSIEEQKVANALNEDLADRFYDVFLRADRNTNGMYSGGFVKDLAIRAAEVPIEFERPDDVPTPLERVLQKAYALLHRHYKRIDRIALERFAAVSKTTVPTRLERETGMGRQKSPSHVPIYDEDAMGMTPRSICSSSSYGSSSTGNGTRPLDTHDALKEVLRLAFCDENGQPTVDLADYKDDCLFDQCTNLPMTTSTRRKAFSGVSLARPLQASLKNKLGSVESGSVGSSRLRSTAEESEDEDHGGDGRASPSRPSRSRLTKVLRKPATPEVKKAATAKVDSPPRKAKAAMQAKVARKAAAMPKAEGSRKRKAGAAKASAPTKKAAPKALAKAAPAKKAASKASVKASTAAAKAPKAAKTAGPGATRRSARLAADIEEAPLPAATGKRKRAGETVDPEEVQPGAKTTRKRRVVENAPTPAPKKPAAAKAKAAASRKAKPVQEAPARRSSRLAAKNT
ncbi:hypothetical protein PsYK624_099250 [Phanerochaete sordida]|uniref:Fungal-type protein kinase domain-containing protein n=1 Tax=Phanerochaete sordida TaxID=48140 RepID=A0A9P3GGA3_9APHY|nr:hypothetical protein PsYK624_099250 [Phanerochaete sordida]